MRPQIKRHHGFNVLLFILGTLFPPLAVAARFGIGSDFWLNLLLTICGYIPGHCHNFYIQNVRNNKNHSRTPKWAQRYGLVDTSTIKRHEQRSQWAHRYNDRNPHSTLEDQPLEAGENSPDPYHRSDSTLSRQPSRPSDNRLWNMEDESYYSNGNGGNGSANNGSANAGSGGGGRWQYPANFDNALPELVSSGSQKKKKSGKDKRDRWSRTEEAHATPDQGSRKKKKKKSKNTSTVGDAGGDWNSTYSRHSESTADLDGPEDPTGNAYSAHGGSRPQAQAGDAAGNGHAAGNEEDVFNHEF